MSQLQFHDLAVSKEMHRAIGDLGYVTATEIQQQAIPVLLEGTDIVGQAQTGTGKTAAFGIPLIEKIERGHRNIQSIVLCPTRELAVQVCEELRKLARYRKDIRIVAIYGGVSIEKQRNELRRGAQIVVGTPGRFIDQIERGALKLDTVLTVVLDEADEMLNMGFRPYIEKIMALLPKERQTALFSATMSKDIRDIANRYLNNPTTISIAKKELTADNIEQVYYETLGVNKTNLISTILETEKPDSVMIFCNTKRRVDLVVKKLKQDGYETEGIHGDFTQRKRMRTMNDFRKGFLNVLVATDVAARGLDISSVTMVINYDLPLDPEYYVHRIGRTGRAGKSGKAITFSHGREEMYRLRGIEKYAKTTIAQLNLPENTYVEPNAAEPEPLMRGSKKYASIGGQLANRSERNPRRDRQSDSRDRKFRGSSSSREDNFGTDRREKRGDRRQETYSRSTRGEESSEQFENSDRRRTSRSEKGSRSQLQFSPQRDSEGSRRRSERPERSSNRDASMSEFGERMNRTKRSGSSTGTDSRRASKSIQSKEKIAHGSRNGGKFGVFKGSRKSDVRF